MNPSTRQGKMLNFSGFLFCLWGCWSVLLSGLGGGGISPAFKYLVMRSPDSVAISPMAPRRGYIADVESERRSRGVTLPPVEVDLAPVESIYSQIYTEELEKEFQRSYQQRFGNLEAEAPSNPTSSYIVYNESAPELRGGVEYQKARQEFGEYMVRRLGEHHVDNYAQQKPGLKKAWEVKDRLSRANVEVSPGYAVNLNYRLSVNRLDMRLVNPYLEADVQWFLSETAPDGNPPVILTLGYEMNPRVRLQSHYKALEREWAVVATRTVSQKVSTSLTALTRLPALGLVEENQILTGFQVAY